VNVLCPGYIETDINSDWFQTDAGKRQIQRWPRKRLMNIGSLDSMLLYLASDASSHVTGAVFTVDDGQTL
jgi:NAD(P)-dependent dehydrogenase (short-subunit alcohol dehydrogenase family)